MRSLLSARSSGNDGEAGGRRFDSAVALPGWSDVMIDHPQFDPVFDHLQKKGIVLMGHLGEPRNCWLPLDEMTVNNARKLFPKSWKD
jgi:hypothetical protein